MMLGSVLNLVGATETVWLHGWINGKYVDVEIKQYAAKEFCFHENLLNKTVFDISAENSKILIGIGDERDGE